MTPSQSNKRAYSYLEAQSGGDEEVRTNVVKDTGIKAPVKPERLKNNEASKAEATFIFYAR
jgi:hypothetical protein